jgi:hypothetical protein
MSRKSLHCDMVYLVPRDDKTIGEADAHEDPLALPLGAINSEAGLTD